MIIRSVILQSATRLLVPLLVLLSVAALLRGHNAPGGGFVGGLIAAAAVVLQAYSCGSPSARRLLVLDPRTYLGIGLLVAIISGLWAPLLHGQPVFTGVWGTFAVPAVGELKIGTPVTFDIGVYLTVLGVVASMALELLED